MDKKRLSTQNTQHKDPQEEQQQDSINVFLNQRLRPKSSPYRLEPYNSCNNERVIYEKNKINLSFLL